MKHAMFLLAIILAIFAISNDRLVSWWMELPVHKMILYFSVSFSLICYVLIRSLGF